MIEFLSLYFIFFVIISFYYTKEYSKTKQSFLVADRQASLWESSLSAASSWVLGLALFASADYAYRYGYVGLVWFVVPQTLSLFVFAWFSKICHDKIPNGYTLSDYMRNRYGFAVGLLYQSSLLVISIGFVALTFTAMTKYLNFLNVENLHLLTGCVALGTVSYSLFGGIKTNLLSGSIQMILMLLFCFILVYLGIEAEGLTNLQKGLYGKENIINLFDINFLLSFGLIFFITSITGIVGNQAYYQKCFSQNKETVYKSFLYGGILFSLVPLSLGILGMLAYGSGIVSKDTANAHLLLMQSHIGEMALIIFGIIMLNASANALDTSGNAVGAIINDFIEDEKYSVLYSRLSICLVAIVGWFISTYNLPMTYIFLTYGIVRVNIFIITLLAVKTDLLNSRSILFSVVTLGIFCIILNIYEMKFYSILTAFFITPVAALTISRFNERIR